MTNLDVRLAQESGEKFCVLISSGYSQEETSEERKDHGKIGLRAATLVSIPFNRMPAFWLGAWCNKCVTNRTPAEAGVDGGPLEMMDKPGSLPTNP
jgi:hypothetical protein